MSTQQTLELDDQRLCLLCYLPRDACRGTCSIPPRMPTYMREQILGKGGEGGPALHVTSTGDLTDATEVL